MIAGFQENIKNKAKGIKKALLGLRAERDYSRTPNTAFDVF